MALRAGYKGIKKKYADAINNGQGGGGGGSLVMEQIFYNNNEPTSPQTEYSLIDGKHFSDYDVIILDVSQPGDGGVYGTDASATNQKVVYLNDPIFKLTNRYSVGDYGQRSIAVTFDFENDKFTYRSNANNESASYQMRIYAIQGIKF